MNHNAVLTLWVELGPRRYPIWLGPGLLSQTGHFVAQAVRQRWGKEVSSSLCVLVTDQHVGPLHAAAVQQSLSDMGWRCAMVQLSAGETAKTLAGVQTVYDTLISQQADRHTMMIALGGGVVGDLAGFAAATYARGIPFFQLPTTLLADVDSSVGGKVGVNHPLAKNMIGAFYQPWGVLIDPHALLTLPSREYRSGLAEVVKYGVIMDADFFAQLEQQAEALLQREPHILTHVIARCCQLKASVVERDEFEQTGLRSILNYGHTFAHAFEALCGYGTLLHGEAVAIGMSCAAELARLRGLIPDSVVERQSQLLVRLGLPTRLPQEQRLSAEDVLARMKLDKKAVSGKLRFVLPTRLGEVQTFSNIPEEEVRTILRGFNIC
ncbi:MAG: 3-dehydroquinate synthase [Planctomycetaceae bacterium]|nr:MAG: 3-dehydroquinate synthase [Planctomycetaceae bacterium]